MGNKGSPSRTSWEERDVVMAGRTERKMRMSHERDSVGYCPPRAFATWIERVCFSTKLSQSGQAPCSHSYCVHYAVGVHCLLTVTSGSQTGEAAVIMKLLVTMRVGKGLPDGFILMRR